MVGWEASALSGGMHAEACYLFKTAAVTTSGASFEVKLEDLQCVSSCKRAFLQTCTAVTANSGGNPVLRGACMHENTLLARE